MQQTDKLVLIRFAIPFLRFGGLALFALFVWHYTLVGLLSYQQDNNWRLQALVKQKQADISVFEARERTKIDLEARLSFIMSLHNRNERSANVLKELGRAFPQGVLLNQLIRQNSTLILSGDALSDSDIVYFMGNIEKSPLFDHPTIIAIAAKNGGGGVRDFQLKINQRPG